jgi:cobalt/nickel transport system permease protein
VKVVATVLTVVAFVSAPREAVWVFAAFAGLVTVVAVAAGVPVPALARRLRLELPFVAFALLLPFTAAGPRREVLGVGLAEAGLWGAWNILAKATLGVAAVGVLAAATPVPDLLRGFERLRAPRLLTAIAGFMCRYGEVLAGEAGRMRVARLSRGDDPRWLWQTRALAASSGTLFVRSYERGERVHLAMQSRGFGGSMPDLGDGPGASPRQWLAGLAVPAVAAALSAIAWALR